MFSVTVGISSYDDTFALLGCGSVVFFVWLEVLLILFRLLINNDFLTVEMNLDIIILWPGRNLKGRETSCHWCFSWNEIENFFCSIYIFLNFCYRAFTHLTDCIWSIISSCVKTMYNVKRQGRWEIGWGLGRGVGEALACAKFFAKLIIHKGVVNWFTQVTPIRMSCKPVTPNVVPD